MSTHHAFPAGCTKVPWGFIEKNGLVANTSVAERNARAELGEFAIGLLGKLGLDEAIVKALSKSENPLEILQKLQERANVGTPAP